MGNEKEMKIQFIGTGAADHEWSRYGEPGVMGSTVTLLDDHILIDCGPTALCALERYQADIDKITDIVITHSHTDHFDRENLKAVCTGRKLRLWGSGNVCGKAAEFCETRVLHYGMKFRIGRYDFLALEANHAVEDPTEETFLYLISGEKTLLYALDTGYLSSKAHRLLGKTRIDGAVWDATMSEPGDWRLFDHTDGRMFNIQRGLLERTGNMTPDTKVWFSHRARTLWPQELELQRKITERENVLLAIEGETVYL